MNADGGNVRRLTDDPSYTGYPVWSPDGKQIAFMSDTDGDFEIFSVKIADGKTVQLTDNDVDDLYPAWSTAGQ